MTYEDILADIDTIIRNHTHPLDSLDSTKKAKAALHRYIHAYVLRSGLGNTKYNHILHYSKIIHSLEPHYDVLIPAIEERMLLKRLDKLL